MKCLLSLQIATAITQAKTGPRFGDKAEMVLLELVEQ
jgi:hypothetical protein